MGTFSLGISGLSAAKKNLNTVGNNIANASTVGFKRSRAEFADVYAKSGLGSATGLTGNGVRVSNIAQQFGQGGTTFTQNSLDLAIDGSGFFIVKDGNGTTSYTRAGMFGIDKEGFVISSTGQKLQGYPANANGDDISVGVIDNIYISQSNVEPNATSKVDIAFNLDSRAEPPTNYIFDANDSDTYTHIYPSVLYDTLGNSHTMTQYFVKQPPYLPEYGEPTRAIQTLIGAARYGVEGVMDGTGNYTSINEGENIFPGDAGASGNNGAGVDDTLDSDIQAIFDAVGSGFSIAGNFDGSDPISSADANGNNDGTADTSEIEAEYANRIGSIKTALEGMVDSSSGRIKEFYEEVYSAINDYLPTVPGTITKGVFDGALSELENTLSGGQRAYAGIDKVTGDLRSNVLTAGADPLTDELNLGNLRTAFNAPYTTLGEDYQAQYDAIVTELESRRDANPGTEEAGVYQLALNALQDVEKDWGDDTAASETMLKVLNALESEAAENRWHMYVSVDGEMVTDANANTPEYFSFNFTEFGALDEPLPTMKIKDWVPKDGLGNQNGSDEPQIFEIDLTNTTQFAGAFGANSLYQDGYATGELAGLDIDESGTIIARYTNSQTQLIGQVALANFRNEQGLTPVGGTMWAASTTSGDPVVNEPGVSIAGNIMSKALEDSNVDLSEELVNMIIAQRDYQANAKTLQTADTITQTIINLR
ncbi:flagellar hook-basal body complex protein [Oceanospirillum sanctuarii]|uniref:flagellar hook-basal body complex protein n=1 Tax=Oceanospirillum sanctuarii TaxID=1434821 RepID=UPI000A37C102|nr:flagellar hook-basal body complex protein [Oceanospirillum sanctuarii]